MFLKSFAKKLLISNEKLMNPYNFKLLSPFSISSAGKNLEEFNDK